MATHKAVEMSDLEKALSKSLKSDANDQFELALNLLRRMADRPTKQMVVSSYPACNSVA